MRLKWQLRFFWAEHFALPVTMNAIRILDKMIKFAIFFTSDALCVEGKECSADQPFFILIQTSTERRAKVSERELKGMSSALLSHVSFICHAAGIDRAGMVKEGFADTGEMKGVRQSSA
ncbi:uncharacterized protein MONOS_17933 [Monocercomonoides exilis]|uniref:uncharacterized protein n=1 Tax=Monocercomonoides exilis TaxID=2049356 RepID=UPI0035598600|nr:hypothetical protein MONOS_17933 [Monocercomonoides exilis]